MTEETPGEFKQRIGTVNRQLRLKMVAPKEKPAKFVRDEWSCESCKTTFGIGMLGPEITCGECGGPAVFVKQGA